MTKVSPPATSLFRNIIWVFRLKQLELPPRQLVWLSILCLAGVLAVYMLQIPCLMTLLHTIRLFRGAAQCIQVWVNTLLLQWPQGMPAIIVAQATVSPLVVRSQTPPVGIVPVIAELHIKVLTGRKPPWATQSLAAINAFILMTG